LRIKVAIIGMGHVGTAFAELLKEHAEVISYDVRQDGDYPITDLSACEIGVVCVDTPASNDGSCDTSKVSDAITKLPVRDVLLKSTVSPGTTDRLVELTGKNICYSPEYVGEPGYYSPFWRDGMRSVPFVILGGAPTARHRFIDLLMPILGPTKTYFQCTAIEAEIVKYMENAYLAIKVTFVTEFRNICKALAADWHTVREGWLLDPRIEPSHTAVFPGSPGFGGKCLPKDLRAITCAAAKAGYEPRLLLEAIRINEHLRDLG
jgi:UDPglucose 6-dehydrogenase